MRRPYKYQDHPQRNLKTQNDLFYSKTSSISSQEQLGLKGKYMKSPLKSQQIFGMERVRRLQNELKLSAEIKHRLQAAISLCVSSFLVENFQLNDRDQLNDKDQLNHKQEYLNNQRTSQFSQNNNFNNHLRWFNDEFGQEKEQIGKRANTERVIAKKAQKQEKLMRNQRRKPPLVLQRLLPYPKVKQQIQKLSQCVQHIVKATNGKTIGTKLQDYQQICIKTEQLESSTLDKKVPPAQYNEGKRQQVKYHMNFPDLEQKDVYKCGQEWVKSREICNLTKKNQQCPGCGLTQSNKNFIVELLIELGLLKYYKDQDRSFLNLINQAQKRYFSTHMALNHLQRAHSQVHSHQDYCQDISCKHKSSKHIHYGQNIHCQPKVSSHNQGIQFSSKQTGKLQKNQQFIQQRKNNIQQVHEGLQTKEQFSNTQECINKKKTQFGIQNLDGQKVNSDQFQLINGNIQKLLETSRTNSTRTESPDIRGFSSLFQNPKIVSPDVQPISVKDNYQSIVQAHFDIMQRPFNNDDQFKNDKVQPKTSINLPSTTFCNPLDLPQEVNIKFLKNSPLLSTQQYFQKQNIMGLRKNIKGQRKSNMIEKENQLFSNNQTQQKQQSPWQDLQKLNHQLFSPTFSSLQQLKQKSNPDNIDQQFKAIVLNWQKQFRHYPSKGNIQQSDQL